jgi:hypothetical protein
MRTFTCRSTFLYDLELLSWSVCGVREVGYRILSHGALPLDLRSNAGILYVAACGEDDRQLLPGTLLRVDSVTHISISIYFVSCNPLLPCNFFLSVGN